MERQFFSGNTLEQAVLAAARHHGLDPERVAYKTRDKKHGFLNIRRRVVIEVDPAAPERTDETPIERALDDSGEDNRGRSSSTGTERHSNVGRSSGAAVDRHHDGGRHGEDRQEQSRWRGEETSWDGSGEGDDEAVAVADAIDKLGKLVGVRLESSIERVDKGFEIEVSGTDTGLLRENQGSGLDAVEHLLPRLVRGLNGYGVPCRVDSEGFRTAREEELIRLARDAAEDVSRDGEERRLEPMNPADRRQVHMALVDDPAVGTESEGEGFLKRVRIVPL